jgi:hypothetical protein
MPISGKRRSKTVSTFGIWNFDFAVRQLGALAIRRLDALGLAVMQVGVKVISVAHSRTEKCRGNGPDGR